MTTLTTDRPYMVGPGKHHVFHLMLPGPKLIRMQGNHEANCDNGGTTGKVHNITYDVSICMPGQTNFTGYRNHFRMPSSESAGLGNFWYSFDHGMVHYVQIDTETDLGHGLIAPDEPGGSEGEDAGPFSNIKNAQTNWLAEDLASVDRAKTPWILVAGHRPWYISAQNDSSDVCLECQSVFEPLFIQYGVDLVLSGHVHAYERNAPLANYAVDPAGLNQTW